MQREPFRAAIGHEHFMTGVRMLYACRYRDAVNHFQEAIMLEPAAKGYLSYLGLAVAHADRKYNDAEQLCRRSIEVDHESGNEHAGRMPSKMPG